MYVGTDSKGRIYSIGDHKDASTHKRACLFRFAESVVDRLNDVLVQLIDLLLDSSFDRAAEMKNAMRQAQANGKQNRDYLQIDFGIEQFAKGLFAGGLQKDHSNIKNNHNINCTQNQFRFMIRGV